MFSMTEGEMLAAWKIDAAKASMLIKKRDNPAGYKQAGAGIHGAKGGPAQGMSPDVARAICAVGQVIEAGARKSSDVRGKLVALCKVSESSADRMVRTTLDRRMIAVIATGSSPVRHNFYGLTDAGREFLAKNRGQV